MSRWISHRGCRYQFTENTLSAFREAVAQGFRHLETDLRMTADRQIVLFHDEDLARLTGDKLKISELSLSELQKIKLPCGEKVPRLVDFLAEFNLMDWTLDIKEPGGSEVLKELLHIPQLQQKKDLRFVVWDNAHRNWIQSNFPESAIYEDLKTCQLAGFAAAFRIIQLFPLRHGRIYSLPYQWRGFKFFRKDLVQHFHSRGAKLLAFLPKTPEEARAAEEAGFDEILSNFPPAA